VVAARAELDYKKSKTAAKRRLRDSFWIVFPIQYIPTTRFVCMQLHAVFASVRLNVLSRMLHHALEHPSLWKMDFQFKVFFYLFTCHQFFFDPLLGVGCVGAEKLRVRCVNTCSHG
jgi:hypothetical protein